MAELRLKLDDDFINQLRADLGQNLKITDILREALTTYNWAVGQRRKGRVILSGTEDGEAFLRLAQLSLDKVPTDPENVKLATATAGAQ